MSVLQEQAIILYAIAALLVVLNVIGVAVYIRLGEVRDALTGRSREPKMSDFRIDR